MKKQNDIFKSKNEPWIRAIPSLLSELSKQKGHLTDLFHEVDGPSLLLHDPRPAFEIQMAPDVASILILVQERALSC